MPTNGEKADLVRTSLSNPTEQELFWINLLAYIYDKADGLGADDNYVTDAEKAKLGNITVTQAVDLDTIESDTVTNNAKVTNATHTGEVTGSGALVLDKTAITGKSEVTAVGTDYILISDTSDSGNLKKALASDLTGGGGGLSHPQILARCLGC